MRLTKSRISVIHMRLRPHRVLEAEGDGNVGRSTLCKRPFRVRRCHSVSNKLPLVDVVRVLVAAGQLRGVRRRSAMAASLQWGDMVRGRMSGEYVPESYDKVKGGARRSAPLPEGRSGNSAAPHYSAGVCESLPTLKSLSNILKYYADVWNNGNIIIYTETRQLEFYEQGPLPQGV